MLEQEPVVILYHHFATGCCTLLIKTRLAILKVLCFLKKTQNAFIMSKTNWKSLQYLIENAYDG